MTTTVPPRGDSAAISEIRALARPLRGLADLTPLVQRLGDHRFVCLGEASHGTHEYYRWRAELSRRLILEHGFTWIGGRATGLTAGGSTGGCAERRTSA